MIQPSPAQDNSFCLRPSFFVPAPSAVDLSVENAPRCDPLDVPCGWNGSWDRRIAQATSAFVVLGVVVRLWRYALRFPLWGDECFVAVNFLERDYLDLLRPLDYGQVAPLLFLWVELSVVKLCGFTEWSLRLFPCLCSVASVFLFRHVAGRLLRGVPLLLAVGIFAVAYYPVRHGAEVKPYASDLFVSLVLLALAIECWREPERTGWLWLLAVVGPVAIGLSYPAVFIAGGISSALFGAVRRSRNGRVWIAYGLYNLAVLGSFLALSVVFTGPQYESALRDGVMGTYWAAHFPPLTSPLRLVSWLVQAHTGHMFAYPVGGDRGASTLTFVCFVAGVIALGRRKRWAMVALFLWPFALTLVAAAMHRYPYGGSARVALYLAPMICLLAGLGGATLLPRLSQERLQRVAMGGSVLVLTALGLGTMARDLICPFKTSYDQRVRDFARWFWTDKATDAELVCARTDLKASLFPHSYAWRGVAQYLCNQRIYSPRHRSGSSTPQWQAVSADRPLRCVVYRALEARHDDAAFSAWLSDMESRYKLVGRETHDFHKHHQNGPPERERVEVYEFIPYRGDELRQAERDQERRPIQSILH